MNIEANNEAGLVDGSFMLRICQKCWFVRSFVRSFVDHSLPERFFAVASQGCTVAAMALCRCDARWVVVGKQETLEEK